MYYHNSQRHDQDFQRWKLVYKVQIICICLNNSTSAFRIAKKTRNFTTIFVVTEGNEARKEHFMINCISRTKIERGQFTTTKEDIHMVTKKPREAGSDGTDGRAGFACQRWRSR